MSRSGVTTDYRFAPIPEQLLYDHSMDPLAVRVYGVLMRHGQDPDSCYPSHARIAKLIGVSERSVARPLKDLANAGWITREFRTSDKGRTSDGYHVRITPAPPVEGKEVRVPQRVEPNRNHAEERGTVRASERGTVRAEERGEREPVEREPVEREGPGDESPSTALEPLPDAAAIKERNRAALDKLPKAVNPEDVKALCLHLRERMHRHHGGPGMATVTPNWVSEMGRLLNSGPKGVDGFVPTAAEVHAMIEAIFDRLNTPQGNSTFCWATVIQSPGNLREKWPRIAADLGRDRTASPDGMLAVMRQLDEMGVSKI
jgi:hypothetical protein